jgi:hypothetical protein
MIPLQFLLIFRATPDPCPVQNRHGQNLTHILLILFESKIELMFEKYKWASHNEGRVRVNYYPEKYNSK